MSQTFPETRMFWLSDGEEVMTLAFFVLLEYRSVSDGPRVGQTDISSMAIGPTSACIDCYANALV